VEICVIQIKLAGELIYELIIRNKI